MTSNLELYEALKLHLDEDVAKMVAEALPVSQQFTTKADLHAMEARIYRWMLTFNLTLFLGLAGMIVAILLKP
jgi:hypothetical protein